MKPPRELTGMHVTEFRAKSQQKLLKQLVEFFADLPMSSVDSIRFDFEENYGALGAPYLATAVWA
jgi:hypothetical protein